MVELFLDILDYLGTAAAAENIWEKPWKIIPGKEWEEATACDDMHKERAKTRTGIALRIEVSVHTI